MERRLGELPRSRERRAFTPEADMHACRRGGARAWGSSGEGGLPGRGLMRPLAALPGGGLHLPRLTCPALVGLVLSIISTSILGGRPGNGDTAVPIRPSIPPGGHGGAEPPQSANRITEPRASVLRGLRAVLADGWHTDPRASRVRGLREVHADGWQTEPRAPRAELAAGWQTDPRDLRLRGVQLGNFFA